MDIKNELPIAQHDTTNILYPYPSYIMKIELTHANENSANVATKFKLRKIEGILTKGIVNELQAFYNMVTE